MRQDLPHDPRNGFDQIFKLPRICQGGERLIKQFELRSVGFKFLPLPRLVGQARVRHGQGQVPGNSSRNGNITPREIRGLSREEIHGAPGPTAEADGDAKDRFHASINGGPLAEKYVVLYIVENNSVPLLRHLPIGDRHHKRHHFLQTRARMQFESLAVFAELNNAHDIMREQGLHNMRDAVEYLSNVEHVGQRIQQSVKHLEA